MSEIANIIFQADIIIAFATGFVVCAAVLFILAGRWGGDDDTQNRR